MEAPFAPHVGNGLERIERADHLLLKPRRQLEKILQRQVPLRHLQAINGVEQHVNRKSDAEQARARHERQQYVGEHKWPCMQRMETHAAAQGIVYRVGEQMIYVNDHTGH